MSRRQLDEGEYAEYDEVAMRERFQELSAGIRKNTTSGQED